MTTKKRIATEATIEQKYIKYPAIMRDGEKSAEYGLEETATIETDDGKFVVPKGGKIVTPLWGATKEMIIESLNKQKTNATTKAQDEATEQQAIIDAVTAIK